MIRPMDSLRSVDLNLLVVLDALLDEAHVTRAAARLGLSQPAASSALERLRHLFGDPLLERRRGGMRPTAAAEALRPALKAALASVRAVLDAPAVDLLTVRRTVRLVMADALAVEAVSALRRRLSGTAPGVSLALLPWRGASEAVARLARGEADLVASVLPPLGAEFRRVALAEERYAVVMRRDHPAAAPPGRFDLGRWLAFPHVVVSGEGRADTPLDAELAARGLSRTVAVAVPSFLMVPPLLLGSDLLALLPRRCVPKGGGRTAAFVALPPPVPVEGFRLDLAWHRRGEDDAVVRHVAAALAAALRPGPPDR